MLFCTRNSGKQEGKEDFTVQFGQFISPQMWQYCVYATKNYLCNTLLLSPRLKKKCTQLHNDKIEIIAYILEENINIKALHFLQFIWLKGTKYPRGMKKKKKNAKIPKSQFELRNIK